MKKRKARSGRRGLMATIAILALMALPCPGISGLFLESAGMSTVSAGKTPVDGKGCLMVFEMKSDFISIAGCGGMVISHQVKNAGSAFGHSVDARKFLTMSSDPMFRAAVNTMPGKSASETSLAGETPKYKFFHRARRGQTLAQIAGMYMIPSGDILKANGITDAAIQPGQKIYLPLDDREELISRRRKYLGLDDGAGTLKVASVADSRRNAKGPSRVILRTGRWPVANCRFTSPFGMRMHPLFKKWKFHNGVDLAAPKNVPIVAAAGGVVSFVGWKSYSGRTVIVNHPSGFQTLYMHCSSTQVKQGDRVSKGQLIARVGRTGSATGHHLHFSIKKGNSYLDPVAYVSKI